MGIDELLKNIEEVGVGADTKVINKHIVECQAAINLGIATSEEMRSTVSYSNKILQEIGGRLFDDDIKLKGESNIIWQKYAEYGSEEAEKYIELSKDIYRESSEIRVVFEKIHFGPKIELEYNNGALRAGYVRFYGKRGKMIIDKDSDVKGVPKTIATAKPLRVYGTLAMNLSDFTQYGLLSSIFVRELKKENCGKLRFIADSSNSKVVTVEEELEELVELGFSTEQFVQTVTDIYDFQDKIRYNVEDIFEYNDEEILDNIVFRYDDKEATKIAVMKNNSNLLDNVIAVQAINNKYKIKKEARVNKIELRQEDDIINIIAHATMIDTNEEVEIPITLDDAYKIEALDKVSVIEKGGRLTLSE